MTRVVAAIIEQNGRLLLCQRRIGERLGGLWEFPGGKAKNHETLRAALRRELREELGVEAKVGREIYRTTHRYSATSQPLYITFFGVTDLNSCPRNFVFERIVWCRRKDLARYDFLPADRVLVARLVRGELR